MAKGVVDMTGGGVGTLTEVVKGNKGRCGLFLKKYADIIGYNSHQIQINFAETF